MKAINGRSTAFNRVLVIDNQGIMGAGMEKLLAGDQALEVIGVATLNEQTLVQEIWQLQPDTIILTLESEVINPYRLLEVLQDYGHLRIILASVNSNVMDIYDRQQITANNPGSLIARLRPA
jgi:DNA-binding NarL/FixJ family response regulator